MSIDFESKRIEREGQGEVDESETIPFDSSAKLLDVRLISGARRPQNGSVSQLFKLNERLETFSPIKYNFRSIES